MFKNVTSFAVAIVFGFVLLCGSLSAQQKTDWSDFSAKDFTPQVNAAVSRIDATANAGPYRAQWSSLEQYQIPQWYKDAKLGIFIHWGPYAVPAFGHEWYPREMYIDKDSWRGNVFQHHAKTYGDQKTFGYKDLISGLTAEKFDAAQWVKLFKDAGAKYVIPVAEHHDGFAMYDSDFTQWSATKMGPKRDIVGLIEKEARKEGLHFGVSSHRAFNWMYFLRSEEFDNVDPKFAGLYGRALPGLFEKDAANYQKNWIPHDQQFKDEWLARTCELIDKYDPEIIWFDFGIANDKKKSAEENPFADHLKRFTAYYYNHAAKNGKHAPVVNYKWKAYPEKAAVLDLERSKLDKIRELFWQTDTSVASNTWGYIDNIKYKPVNRIVDDFVDIISKNGCLLLNVCPKKDGTIPQHEQEMLLELGKWMKTNAEAIYGSTTFDVYGEGPTGTVTGHVSESKNKPFGSEDIRFTRNFGNIYVFALDKPENGDVIVKLFPEGNKMLGKVESVQLLGCDEAIKWSQTETGMKLHIPESFDGKHAWVFRITVAR